MVLFNYLKLINRKSIAIRLTSSVNCRWPDKKAVSEITLNLHQTLQMSARLQFPLALYVLPLSPPSGRSGILYCHR